MSASPLWDFARAVTEGRKVFDADTRGVAAWLAFYEAKQAAYANLLARLPQVAVIADFWRYVQNMTVAEWLPLMEREIERATRSRCLCCECGLVNVAWPQRRCAHCQQARRLEVYRRAKQRARIKTRMRKCSVCKNEPLNPRCRICFSCQKRSRRKRNQRYQKSLKGRKLRRVQPDFTSEGMSTLVGSRLFTGPEPNVQREGVLTAGVVA